MSLDSLLASLEKVTPVTLRNTHPLPQKPMWNKAVTLVTPVTSGNIKLEKRLIQTFEHEAAIRGWLSQIGEPIEDQCLVLNKCNCDHEALIYFLKLAGKNEE